MGYRRVCWGFGGRKDFRRENENPFATTLKGGTARAHSAPVLPMHSFTKKRKKGKLLFYWRFLRKTAAAATTTMMTAAAAAIM